MYYFSYASNMDHDQMLKERCPGAKFIGAARLPAWWFVFDGFSTQWGGAVANIVPSYTDEVWGGLYEISGTQLTILDSYEGYPRFYSRQELMVEKKGEDIAPVKAWVYLRAPQPAGFPSKKYHAVLMKGAKDCRLPADYVQSYLRVATPSPDKPSF